MCGNCWNFIEYFIFKNEWDLFCKFETFFSGVWINKLYVILLQAQWYIVIQNCEYLFSDIVGLYEELGEGGGCRVLLRGSDVPS